MYIKVASYGQRYGRQAFIVLGPVGIAANVMYAGMRAQNNPKNYWKRKFAFMFGFPTSIITYLAVEEGSCIAYGIELPRGPKGGMINANWTPAVVDGKEGHLYKNSISGRPSSSSKSADDNK
jgi:hypothetical protein